MTRGRRGAKTDPVVKTVASEAGVPEGFAEEEFGLTILGPVGAHYSGDGGALGRGGSFVADVIHGGRGQKSEYRDQGSETRNWELEARSRSRR